MSTVLALRALGLGDALTAVPALRGLRRHWPGAELVLATSEALGEWLRSLGLVDRVLPTSGLEPLRWTGAAPDVAVNLHGCGPESHRLLLALDPGELVAFACDEVGVPGPRWLSEDHEVDRWVRLVRSAGAFCSAEDLRIDTHVHREGHVVVHPGAAAGSRRWPAERWAEVASALAARDLRVVVTGTPGTPGEQALCEAVAVADGVENRCGADDLASLSNLVASATLLLSGDTGVAHLATAHRTPSVLLFGPVSPALWGPRIDPDLHRVLWSPRATDPAGDPHADELDVRLARTTVTDVVEAAEELLAPRRVSPPPAPVP